MPTLTENPSWSLGNIDSLGPELECKGRGQNEDADKASRSPSCQAALESRAGVSPHVKAVCVLQRAFKKNRTPQPRLTQQQHHVDNGSAPLPKSYHIAQFVNNCHVSRDTIAMLESEVFHKFEELVSEREVEMQTGTPSSSHAVSATTVNKETFDVEDSATCLSSRTCTIPATYTLESPTAKRIFLRELKRVVKLSNTKTCPSFGKKLYELVVLGLSARRIEALKNANQGRLLLQIQDDVRSGAVALTQAQIQWGVIREHALATFVDKKTRSKAKRATRKLRNKTSNAESTKASRSKFDNKAAKRRSCLLLVRRTDHWDRVLCQLCTFFGVADAHEQNKLHMQKNIGREVTGAPRAKHGRRRKRKKHRSISSCSNNQPPAPCFALVPWTNQWDLLLRDLWSVFDAVERKIEFSPCQSNTNGQNLCPSVLQAMQQEHKKSDGQRKGGAHAEKVVVRKLMEAGVPRQSFRTEADLTMENAEARGRHKTTPHKRTPDVLFKEPVVINGHRCTWLDSKNTLLAPNLGRASTLRAFQSQINDYCTLFGPGAVVWHRRYLETVNDLLAKPTMVAHLVLRNTTPKKLKQKHLHESGDAKKRSDGPQKAPPGD
eukprot:INCI13542.1.p1 GENE.INCI13542.1~~INCI13542.1.p1  ORF type:complete len:645 (+),score=104.35 INCI13542.1:123-1937(+)